MKQIKNIGNVKQQIKHKENLTCMIPLQNESGKQEHIILYKQIHNFKCLFLVLCVKQVVIFFVSLHVNATRVMKKSLQ